jgi:hypothetical protein
VISLFYKDIFVFFLTSKDILRRQYEMDCMALVHHEIGYGPSRFEELYIAEGDLDSFMVNVNAREFFHCKLRQCMSLNLKRSNKGKLN